MVEETVTRHGFVGIKAHRHDAPLTREVCEAARAFSLPVMYDVMGEVSVVELLAEEYPDVPFIIPHLGSFSDDWRAQLALIDHLVRRPNVHADTSGVRRFDLLEQAVRRAGARKILFGSDGPWLHPGVELAKVKALGLPPAEERLVLGGNFLRLISRRRSGGARRGAFAARGRSLQAYGRALQIALLFIDHNPFGQLAGDAFNLLERRPDAIARRITLSKPSSRHPFISSTSPGLSSSGMSPAVTGPGPT